jgi:ATPase subunit of ABC transporter with duplicated ATPase domains
LSEFHSQKQEPGTSWNRTLIFVSHDRWFVSQLATRIFEISPKGVNDFVGTYDEYLERLGDDHLDGEAVMP